MCRCFHRKTIELQSDRLALDNLVVGSLHIGVDVEHVLRVGVENSVLFQVVDTAVEFDAVVVRKLCGVKLAVIEFWLVLIIDSAGSLFGVCKKEIDSLPAQCVVRLGGISLGDALVRDLADYLINQTDLVILCVVIDAQTVVNVKMLQIPIKTLGNFVSRKFSKTQLLSVI